MERMINLKDVSDGRKYELNDMVRADCGDCEGCSACCSQMGASIVLDPLDIHRMTSQLGCSFQELLETGVELNVVDGIVLPNLKMAGVKNQCSYLNQNGRCSIHSFRPGICRIFPLGRLYENRGFCYFLQIHECRQRNRGKVKVRKWIDTEDIRKYETFIGNWHYFLKDLQEEIRQNDSQYDAKKVSMEILKQFYFRAFHADMDFYTQFEERLNEQRARLFFTQEIGDSSAGHSDNEA